MLTVDEVTLKQLYYKNPDFGFQLIGLVAAPLLHDVQRMEGQFGSADRTTPPPH